jgi:hypothetical protein
MSQGAITDLARCQHPLGNPARPGVIITIITQLPTNMIPTNMIPTEMAIRPKGILLAIITTLTCA